MKTELLYLNDSYLKETHATVREIKENKIYFDRTIFHPRSGGLVSDKGKIFVDNKVLEIIEVIEDNYDVAHIVNDVDNIAIGKTVKMVIDWDRRYRLMRMHTGLHVLISVFNQLTNALVTGNQVNPDVSRVDLNLEKPDKELVMKAFQIANEHISKGLNVKIYYLDRDEALKIPNIVKLAKATPPEIKVLRIVEIEGIDIQADGGPHVANTKEIGSLEFVRLENKGKNNRRIYFTLKP